MNNSYSIGGCAYEESKWYEESEGSYFHINGGHLYIVLGIWTRYFACKCLTANNVATFHHTFVS